MDIHVWVVQGSIQGLLLNVCKWFIRQSIFKCYPIWNYIWCVLLLRMFQQANKVLTENFEVLVGWKNKYFILLLYTEWIFFSKKKWYFALKIYVVLVNLQTSTLTLLHHRSYIFKSFFRILSRITGEFG